MKQKLFLIIISLNLVLVGCKSKPSYPELNTDYYQTEAPSDFQVESPSAKSPQLMSPTPEKGTSDLPETLKPNPTQTENPNEPKMVKVILEVPLIKQNPELHSGCEVTSLTMMLQYAGVNVDKMTLASQVRKDKKPLTKSSGDIKEWGDPKDGFVGDMTGKTKGFGVYNKPIFDLTEKYLPGKAVDLTGKSFDTILKSIDNKSPVVIWVTTDLMPPHSYEKWEDNGDPVKVTFQEHAVLLVGYDMQYCYINNPLDGVKKQKVDKATFKKVWTDMGSMAVTYK
jgi:uncharacterized protein YvpB